jgi:hypothetical protein
VGIRNTAIGVDAMRGNTGGTDNTVVGYTAQSLTASVSRSTVLGSYASSTGDGSIVLGYNATGGTNQLVIGDEVLRGAIVVPSLDGAALNRILIKIGNTVYRLLAE